MSEGKRILNDALDRVNPTRNKALGYKIGLFFTPEESEAFLKWIEEQIDDVTEEYEIA